MTKSQIGGLLDSAVADGRIPEPSRPDAPVDPVLLRHALRYAILAAQRGELTDAETAARRIAEQAYALARDRGVTQQEVLLPGLVRVGLVSIKRGRTTWEVDEDLLTAVVAANEPNDFEDVLTAYAAADPRVIALVAEHFPHLVETRIKPARRAEYQKDWEDHSGTIVDHQIGERVQVAKATHHPATGEFSYRPDGKARELILEALRLGQITEDGDYADPPADDAGDPDDGEPDGGSPAPDVPDEPPPGDGALFAPPPAPADDVEARMARALGRTKTSGPAPTGEQAAIIEAVSEATDNLTIEAGAGTGKTTTLRQAAQVTKGSGYYLVFGSANAREARGKFPRGVKVMTTCGMAMAAVGRPFQPRLNSGQVPAAETARILGIRMPLAVDGRMLAPQQQARLVNQMVRNFLISDAKEIGLEHAPDLRGLSTPSARATLAHQLMPYARKAWKDLQDPDGKLQYPHDAYVKMWQLSEPQLPCDYVLLDEAQDTNPVVLAVLNNQASTRRIVSGDSAQAIMEWRGAVNALDYFDGRRLQLSQSFRFGSAVATQANKWLTVLGAQMRLKGFDQIPSVSCHLETADAVLCRTNATAIGEAMRLLDAGVKAGVVGDKMINDLRWLADAAADLKEGRPCTHPDLMAFTTWGQVQDHAENDPNGSDLQVLVKLIDDHGPAVIKSYIDRLAAETDADTVVGTAHRSKGLEWDAVRIAGDFLPPEDDAEIPPEFARLAYVAVTRARRHLDATELAWVDRFMPTPGDDQ